MANYVQLPNGGLFEVREGESPHQAFLKAQEQYPELFDQKPGKKPEGGFGAAFSAGLSRLAGETGLTAGKLGLVGLPAAEEYYRRQQQKAEGIFKPTEKGWTEDPLQKLKEVAGGSAAYMLAPAVAAGAAAFAPVTVPVIGAAGVAAGLAGLGQYTGSNLAAQMEEGKKGLAETSGAAAFGTAIPQAALDVLSFRMMPGIQRLFGATGKELTEAQAKALAEQTLKKKIGDYAKATGVSMGVEGATEVAQDFLEKAQAGAELTDPKAREDYLESLIGGAALAGVLGPFGRGFERAGIAARGRELEQKRVEGERALQQSLTGLAGMERTRAAGAEARQQFGTLFPEIGPAESMYGTQESIQKRLAQIEQEAERARQLKDVSTLSDLQRERTALESRVKEEPSAMEQRQALEQQIAYYQNIEAQLIARAKAAPTAAEKRLILEKLVQVQEQRRQLTNTLLAQEQTGAVPKPTTQEALLNQEKRTIAALQKAEEAGDAAAQLKLTDKLAGLQEQLGLFGQEAYTAQQQFEQKQAEDAAAAEAAARAAQPTLLLTDQRGATPIEMGYNLDTVITPPRVPQAYLQGNLFGSEERVQAPGGTETTLPRLQQAVASLSERPDLSEADRSLLDRVSDLVLPKQQISTAQGVQKAVDEIANRQQSAAQEIEKKKAAQYRFVQKLDNLKAKMAQLNTEIQRQIANYRLAREEKTKAADDVLKAKTPEEKASLQAVNEQKATALADIYARAKEVAAQRRQVEQQLQVLTQKEAAVRERTQRSIDKLERLQENLRKQRTMRTSQREALPSIAAPIERFTTPIETRDAEGNVKTRATPAQLVADWVEALSSGADTTQPRAALENVLGQIQRAGAGEKEALTKLERRIATPEERAALGKKSVVERVPTAVTTTAQQPDLFAGTEAATATEFETPRQMQAFMASDELQKERQKQGKQALAEAQEAGPPKPADVVRSQKLLKPTVAFLSRQADKVRGFLKGLTKRLNDYNALLSAKTEQDEDALAKAKRQQAEILLAIEKTLLKQHQDYARAILEMQSAQETMAGLQDFVDNYVRALDTAVQMSGEWAGVAENERARFQKELEARQDTLRRALGRLGVLRGEITNKFGDILSMEAPALEAGTAFDPELVAAYTQAKADAKKAADDFYGFVKARRKVEPPAHWKVSERDLRQFLMQQAELTDMLFEQGLVVKKWAYTAEELRNKLTAAQEDAKADPVWSAFLKEAQEAVDEATRTPTLRTPDKLMAAIRSANVQINNLRTEARTAAADQEARSRVERRAEAAKGRAAAQAKTQADIKAENERLAREAEAKTRVSFEKRSKKEREEIAALQQRLDQLVADKQTAIDKKREQTTHFRFTKDEKEAIAAGTKTREQVIEAKREEGVKALTAQFDAAIQKLQVEIRAIRGVAKPSEKRAAQLQSTLDLQRRIGEEGPLETAEEVATIAKTQRESRSGQTLVDVRTGRVTEGRMPSAAKALTEAQERREAIEANEISYRNSLLRYVKTQFDSDLSALETDELEYEILRMQAEAEDRAGLRRPATAAEQAKLAKTVAEGVSDPLDRILSHDYAARENTPLDDTTAAAVGKGDLKGALESLAKNGSTPFVRMVAKQLLPMVENTKLETASLEGKGGEYSPNTDTVTLNKDALTEEDLLHEAGHPATYAVASYEAGSGMTRRQFLKGAVTGLTALKLPNITENMSVAAQEKMFFNMLDAWRDWVKAANKLAPALDLDAYTSLDVADGDLRGFLERMEYNEVSDDAVIEMLENGGLKKLQSAINASQRAIMSEAAKQGEAKGTTEKEAPFVPTKEQLAARDALEKLYAKMQGRPEFQDEYGNVDFKEFVSELLSNQQVRDKINQTAGLLRRIYEGFLRMLGIEPKTLSDKALEQAFAMFSPSTTIVGKDERLASIMRGVFPGTQSNFSANVPKSISDTVNRTIARNASLGEKIMANLTGLRLRTFIADQWAPVEALMKKGVAKGQVKAAQALQMQVYMRLFSNMQEYTNSALINGVPQLKKDAAGIRNIEGGDEKVNARAIAKALGKASALGNQQAVERTFTLWMASLRAKQDGVGLEKLNLNLTPQEMADVKQSLVDLEKYFTANPAVRDAFEEARELYRHYNRRLLDLQVQTRTMSKEEADRLAQGDYVGFYRVGDNGVVELVLGASRPMRVGNIIDQPYLKELVGGTQHILPFFASMAQNTSLLMSMALKNMQHTNTAYMFQDMELGKIHGVKEGAQPPEGKLRFKQDGKDFWFAADTDAFKVAGVPEDLMLQGLQGVKTAIPALVKALAIPANVLRKAVRRVPIYTLRQTIRDPMHAWLTTGGNFVPVVSTWKELYRGMTNPSQTQITLKQAAVIGNNVYSGDSEGVVEMLRELTSTPSKFSQIITKFDELAMQGEAATRAVLYDDFRKRGMSHVEALLNTAETMNFSRRGTSASLHWLAQLTPFFNAQIQGLDSAYRALRGQTTFEEKLNARNALLKRGAMMAVSTMVYALMMEDDETYKNATPEERYGNWFVRVPGTEHTVRVPIPFELGLIFKSIPEALVNTAFGDKKASEAAKALAKQIYMSSPFGIPTALKGPLEVMFNYNMYSDQPIETAHERSMDVDQRYRTGTTELAKLLGKFGVLSPVQIDHLVRSYTGSLGIMVASMANMALRPLSGRTDVEKPDMSLNEVPVIGAAFQPTTGRGMVNAVFDEVAKYQQAAMTYKNLAKSDPEAAREYANKFSREIALASTGGSFRQQMGEFAQYKRMIAANPNLTGAEKREQIEKIKQQEIEYSKRVRLLAA